MGSSSFPLTKSDCFPAGLRVLVVDNDPEWLESLEKTLKKFNYEVTTCRLTREAIDLLQERKDGFDIVISDVNMTDMDGFKLLEHVGLKMDIPVIMMSANGETSRVMKGIQHGACDYLRKPPRKEELRNIWKHVFRKRLHEMGDNEVQENRTVKSSDECSFINGDMSYSGNKRKDVEYNNHKDGEFGNNNPPSAKKARVVWSVELHQKFVKAVNQIGLDKVGPKKILELMGVPWLTRENVASHLQKYRLYLGKQQKENELKAACGGIKLSNISPKGPAGNIVPLQSSTNLNHSFGQLDAQVKSEPHNIQAHYSWSTQVFPMKFEQQTHFQHQFHQLPNRGYGIEGEVTEADLLSVQSQSHLANHLHMFKQTPTSVWGSRNQSLETYQYDDLQYSLKNLIVENGSARRLWGEEFINGYSSEGDHFYPMNGEESFGRSNQGLIMAEVPTQLVETNAEYLKDPEEGYILTDPAAEEEDIRQFSSGEIIC